jgi:uncharacterized protein
MNLDLTSMFLLGLFGTGHCLGMCGPLVLAFPAATGKFSSHLYYHLGRALTYTVIGTIVGGAGGLISLLIERIGLDSLSWIPQAQGGMVVLAALFLLLFGLARLGLLREPSWISLASPPIIPRFRSILNSAVQRKSPVSLFFLGVVFGFLPCGLSMAAFSRALASEGSLQGGILTAAFATGTIPGLLLLGTAASRLAAKYRRHSDILSGLIMIGMAATLLYRLIHPHGH